jgi:perosamine synthetase
MDPTFTDMKPKLTRREFLETTAAAGAGISIVLPALARANSVPAANARPAVLGGKPARAGAFPSWPVFDEREEKALGDVLRSRKWFRGSGNTVAKFEGEYARLTGAKHCLAASSGTSALLTALGALEIGPGDEVIIPPYTFVATYNVVALNYALPIFVDSDLETFQIDANKIESAITKQTRAIVPVHLGGAAADMDKILEVAGKHEIPVIEDACQSHLGEWRGRKVGTLGLAGCFSFQASKNLNSGEGGAVLTDDDVFAENCYNFHNQGRGRQAGGYTFAYSGSRGSNLRLTEFQAALLVAQMTRLEEQSRRRSENGDYLTAMLKEIPGIVPAKMYSGCTRNAYHLYMFRYQKEQFANLDKAKFMSALQKEGVPCSGGYSPLNEDSFVRALVKTRHYQKVYSRRELAQWEERNRCPQNNRLCAEAVWFTQNMLLGTRDDMEQIAEAIRKIQKHAAEVARV